MKKTYSLFNFLTKTTANSPKNIGGGNSQKFISVLFLFLTLSVGQMWGTAYTPSADEVIILNDEYNSTATGAGYSDHSAIAWGGAVDSKNIKDKTTGDPDNSGAATSSSVKTFSVKGNGTGKNITVSITGCSKIIVYHESHASRYLRIHSTNASGTVLGTGSISTYYTELTLTPATSYTLFLEGWDGDSQEDFYVYAVKLIKAASGPSVSSFTPASGSKLKTGATVTVAGSSGSTVYCLWASSAQTATAIKSGTAGTSGAASVTSAGIASANGTTLYAVAAKDATDSDVSSATYTIDDTAPTLSSSTPADGANNIPLSGNIVLTFSENVAINDASKFTISPSAGVTLSTGSATVSTNTVTIPYSGLSSETTYTFSTAASAVKDEAGNTSAALSDITFTTIKCGVSSCGNASVTFTINGGSSGDHSTGGADLISSATPSNSTALGASTTPTYTGISMSDLAKKAAATTSTCYPTEPNMSGKIGMYNGSSYSSSNYLQFTFTVKDGYTFTPCDIQFVVQPVSNTGHFRWEITDGSSSYGYGTGSAGKGGDVGATVLTGLTSTSQMSAGTYYIRLYPYYNGSNTFRIGEDVVLRGTTAAAASTKRVYMKCGSTWCDNVDGNAPVFFTHSWVSETTANSTVMQHPSTCETDVYYADIPSSHTNIIFTRQKAGSTELVWSGDNFVNQSQDIDISTNDLFTCTGWSDGKGTFSGSTYSAPAYTVTYNGNGSDGGSVPTDSNSPYDCGDDVTVLGNTGSLTKAGYSFKEWSTAAGGGDSYSAGDTYEDISASVNFYAQWTQEKPTSVTVDGTWRLFPGQTITLTAETEGGTGDFSYQWQKYVDSDWSDLDDEESATYTKANCTTSDCGSYRCVVTKAGGSTESNAYDVHIYTLNGNYDGDDWVSNDLTVSSGTVGTLELDLEAGRLYKFKVKDNFYGYWFGNSGYILKSESSWACPKDGDDIRVFTGAEGTYTFTVDIANVNYGTPEVTVSVTYPSVTHPVEGYIYYDKSSNDWTNIEAHWWKNEGTVDFVAWDNDPWMTQTTIICGTTYHYMPKLEGYDRLIIHKADASGSGNQTADITVSASSSGKYIVGLAADWNTFTFYSITYAANGGTGTMSAIENICPDADQALTANAFEKTGYSFAGWKANVAVTISGESVSAGTVIDDEATLEDIDSDITLTAQWTANTYDVAVTLTDSKATQESGDTGDDAATYGTDYESTFKAVSGYVLPSDVTVSIGGSTKTKDTEYTWSVSEGVGTLTIDGDYILDDIAITVTAVVPTYTVTYNGNSPTTGSAPTDSSSPYEAGASVTVLGDNSMTKSGSTFRGWTYGDYFYKAGDTFTMPANNVTFTAVWDGGSVENSIYQGSATGASTWTTTVGSDGTNSGFPNAGSSDPYACKWSGTSSYLRINPKSDYSFAAGDTLVVTIYNNNSSAKTLGYKVGGSDIDTEIAGNSSHTFKNVVTASMITSGYIDLYRHSSTSGGFLVSAKEARYTKSNFTVSFDDQTGFAGSSTLPNDIVGVPTGKKILQPSNPTATGYTFGGWYSDAACSNTFSFSGTITKDTTIYAKWTATPFSITYSDPSNGSYTIQVADGDASSETKENANCGQTITLAATPEANYIFTTWTITKTSDESDVTDAVSLSDQTATATFTMPAYGVKITATFERVYTLSYNAHGGSGAPSGDSYIAGAEITLSGTKPTNTGYSFNSWNTEENGGGDSYAAGADFTMPAEDVTLYAQWDIVELSDDYASVTMTAKNAATAKNCTKILSGTIGESSNPHGYKLNASPSAFGLTLAENFRVGDVIEFKIYALYATCYVWTSESATTSIWSSTSLTANSDQTIRITVTQDMLDAGLTKTAVIVYNTGDDNDNTNYKHCMYYVKVERTHCPECITLKSGTTTWSSTASDWIDKDGVASALPTIEDVVLLDADVTITAGTTAKAKGVVIADERSLTIAPTGALIVAETLTKNGTATTASDVELQSSSSGTAALIVGGESTNTQATVGFYTKAKKDDGKYINQYIGVPFASMTTYDRFYGTYLYSFDVATDSWKVVPNNGDMYPFTAYNLLRKETSETTFYSGGTLVLPGTTDHKTKELTMTKCDGEDKTENMFANSWTAPIDIKAMETSDFVGAEATIYIFNAGTYAQQQAAKATMDSHDNTNAGQWVAIPVEAADYADWDLTVIPSQQAFLVYTSGTGGTYKLTLDYKKHVYEPAVESGVEIKPTRAPRRTTDDKPEVMSMRVAGESGYADVVYMFFREDFSDGFDNGWDGRKMEGSSTAPQMYAYSGDGKMAIHATAEAEGTLLGFKAGNTDNLYTVTFSYEGDETYYLNDLQEQESALIEDENTYMFYATPEDDETRFVVSKTPIHKIATDVEGVGENPTVRKLLIENQLFIIRSGRMYGVDGSLVK